MGIELIRFDMSEYMERHTVSRLIGAPPGYVGFDQGGLLTEAITKHPHCVLLLDEIEKAHPDIFNILLQVMDHGTLTDNNGRKADFRNVVIVMTTNAGAEMLPRSIGFTEFARAAGDEMAEIKRLFTPEFRNRLDAIISFAALDHEVILRVVDKFLMQLEAQLHEKKVEALFTDKLKDWLAEKGFDPLMGARPMARLIQDTIRAALADELLFGRLANGGRVTIDLDDRGIVVYGCIRDSVAIGEMDIGVLALDTHPLKSIKRNVGEADIPVAFAGAGFIPGHYLYADADGVLVSPTALLA
jgi:ATP-dependent Clp protease ATP-binding subunit ClpA